MARCECPFLRGAGAACGEGRWPGGRARRRGAASSTQPRGRRLASPLGPELRSGATGVRRGDCAGLGSASMVLCVPFLAWGWGQRRPHANSGPCRAVGMAVLPIVVAVPPVPRLVPLPALLYPSPRALPVPAPWGRAARVWGASASCYPTLSLAVRWAGVELLGPAGDAGGWHRRAGDDGAGGAGLAAGETCTSSTQMGHSEGVWGRILTPTTCRGHTAGL